MNQTRTCVLLLSTACVSFLFCNLNRRKKSAFFNYLIAQMKYRRKTLRVNVIFMLIITKIGIRSLNHPLSSAVC